MYTRGRTLRFTAVVTLVVVSLTGFSTGRHHSTRHRSGSHSSSGGGCSSSHQNHDGYKSSSTHKRYRSTPSSTGGSGATALQDGTAVLVSCATVRKPYSTVAVTNPNSRSGTFTVRVTFLDASGGWLGSAGKDVSVPGQGKATVQVKATDTALVRRADHCDVVPAAVVKE